MFTTAIRRVRCITCHGGGDQFSLIMYEITDIVSAFIKYVRPHSPDVAQLFCHCGSHSPDVALIYNLKYFSQNEAFYPSYYAPCLCRYINNTRLLYPTVVCDSEKRPALPQHTIYWYNAGLTSLLVAQHYTITGSTWLVFMASLSIRSLSSEKRSYILYCTVYMVTQQTRDVEPMLI